MGISFAIPIDLAIQIAEQLKTTGKISRGQLGISIQAMTQELSKSLGLPTPEGALVTHVFRHSPAEKAGLALGDVILSVNGKRIIQSRDLPLIIGNMQPNEKAQLRILRDRKEVTIDVILSALESTDEVSNNTDTPSSAINDLGLAVMALTIQEQEKMNLPFGLMITQAQGHAAKQGLMPGDVLMKFNQTDMTDLKAFTTAVETMKPNNILLIRRANTNLFISFEAP